MDTLTAPKLVEGYSDNGEKILCCPHCSGNYLRHKDVGVFNRSSEDSDQGISIKISELHAITDTRIIGNPSIRRNGILIGFECELCGKQSELAIYQHKGQTSIRWNC